MNKAFNITADCKPGLHYMVDLQSRLEQIRGYVDRGEYLSINHARQYGKTTTLRTLNEYLKDTYYVVGMDFQMQMSDAEFEADSAANHQVFLDFLAQLRGYYIDRDRSATFRSVILAGVYDIRNLKRKFRSDEDHKRNSPWNIAVEFKVDMSFSADEIAGMLEEYEKDHATGMDPAEMARLIYEHTSGYPFLVSKLCKLMDEEVAGSERFPGAEDAWTCAGFLEAERMLLGEKNTLFESMVNKLYDFPELKDIVYSILFTGKESSYNALNEAIGTAEMFGFVKNVNGVVAIANRIFEMVFYNLFLTSAENQKTDREKTNTLIDGCGEWSVTGTKIWCENMY